MRRHGFRWWLYLFHRWLGIVTCLFFAMWFASGLVMIYVPFPALTEAERLAGATPLDWSRVKVQPRAADLLDAKALALEMRDGAPVWRMRRWAGDELDLSAVDGRSPEPTDAVAARRIATTFGKAEVTAISPIVRDQWTVAGGYDRFRPLWKAELAGAGGRILYVSAVTGSVVLDTDARERLWNWLGSVPHWLYPTVLRRDNALWRQVVLWVSGPCIVGAVAGMWIGVLRTRLGRRRFKDGRATPYRGWMHWHHIAGLIGGTFLTTWIFSGWLSVDPGRFFASPGLSEAATRDYAGVPTLALDLPRLASIGKGARRIDIDWFQGRPMLKLVESGSPHPVLDARTLLPASPREAMILAAAARLVPKSQIAAVERLTAPDAYWYEVGVLPRLPVLRIKFDDAARTWVHVDPATGEILGDLDARRRLYRWLFDLLHKWDFNGLTLNRPAWDVVLWTMSLFGLVISVSGVRIGWSRLNRRR